MASVECKLSIQPRGVHLEAEPWNPALRAMLAHWHAAGVRAVDPAAVTSRAMRRDPPPTDRPAVLALGKAAVAMLEGACAALAERGVVPLSVLVITDEPGGSAVNATIVVGDHPAPGARSAHAAAALAEWIAGLPTGSPVIVLLSGGTSSLIAAPLPGITPDELYAGFGILHQLGLDIVTMNAARRQLTGWSGGRLRTALGSRSVVCYVISDVPTTELAAIGSGPLIGRALDLDGLQRGVINSPTFPRFAPTVQRALTSPPPPAVTPTPHTVVASGAMLLHHLGRVLADAGLMLRLAENPLIGTTTAGAEIVSEVIAAAIGDRDWDLLGWAGELTVALGDAPGVGGRCQQFAVELALLLEAAARHLPALRDVLVLATGTDGRDGPTDAAGAYASAHLPGLLRAAGFDPRQLLRARDTHMALDRVGALHRTGHTGTNVADLILVSRSSALGGGSGPGDG